MNREEIIRALQLDANFIYSCGGHDHCIHYGEGCALGYPLLSVLNGRGGSWQHLQEADRAMLKRMYSPDFHRYWRDLLRTTRFDASEGDERLPCSHQSSLCSFNHCGYLDNPAFMSDWYKRQHASVDSRVD